MYNILHILHYRCKINFHSPSLFNRKRSESLPAILVTHTESCLLCCQYIEGPGHSASHLPSESATILPFYVFNLISP